MAISGGAAFVDHYAVFGGGACPDISAESLKKIYFEKLKEYHPDKRPGSAGVHGQQVTQALNEAYEILRDPARREAYDATWRREKEAALPAFERAELYRRRGNDLYSKARDVIKGGENVMNLAVIHQGMALYKSAMEEYGKAMELAPSDHRLYSNRALCYLAVEDYHRAFEDARRCTHLRPDFKKGWLLAAKALWKLDRQTDALNEIQIGLRHLPGCAELLELDRSLARDGSGDVFAGASRSVSPALSGRGGTTPPPQRSNSRSPVSGRPVSGQSRPVSPPLVAAGTAATRRSGSSPGPGIAQTYAGPSRSPGLNLDASGTFNTGNFGAPTPSFAAGRPPADAMKSSFPAFASAMWAGQPPNNKSHSPGPLSGRSTGSQTYGGTSRSPGPDLSARSGGTSRSPGPAIRKSTSLRGMLESSQKGPTPPHSRGPTPPRGNG
mmetsp:Transcript_83252/g.156672  ORF Transcript_83252/g.156672 Transcript_83252/m.156672 type:complete len:439 (+) Transcript_83252:49-1365(+)